MIRGFAVLLAGIAAAGPVLSQTVALTFLCERGVEIPVAYVSDGDAVVLWAEGRMINLYRAPAASGARYAFPSDKSTYIWWEHQGKAQLSWFDAEDGTEQMIYAACAPLP